ncbi:hypothetical protein [Leclercia adecarboxylata]|uniref:hypothetical protein n=1 Tax=Leclercia adecarboxylata TaxID=83655 RepID=UPI00111BA958|nr:hypothetical protein [Leclercia adecarboxylata]QCZ30198.1 hypothetical protein FHN83_26900 [Leclercia adecarboxylata]
MSKDYPVFFNDEMVRAILDGRKSQTRRLIKLSHERGMLNPVVRGRNGEASSVTCRLAPSLCPYGQPGDRLWVRETWALLGNEDGCCVDWHDNLCKGDERSAARVYRASCERHPGDYGLWSIPDDADWKPHTENQKFDGAWRPSIHMPRWACRILLEITNVRVERLNDISEADAQAEGVTPSTHQITPPEAVYRVGFGDIWRSIYGEESWEGNPWVWVVEFKRVQATSPKEASQ